MTNAYDQHIDECMAVQAPHMAALSCANHMVNVTRRQMASTPNRCGVCDHEVIRSLPTTHHHSAEESPHGQPFYTCSPNCRRELREVSA